MKVIVLGGGGAMGMVTVQDLAESPQVSEVLIGEADLKQADKVAKWTGSEKDGHKMKHTYSRVHRYKEEYGVSALAYLTGMPMSIVAQMLAKDEISASGVLPAESAVEPKPFFAELSKRGVEIFETSQSSHRI